MGQRYYYRRENFTPTAGQDAMTVVTASARRARLVEARAQGLGSSSAGQYLMLVRSGTGTTGGGAITAGKGEHTEQPAAASVVNTTWSVQPTAENGGHILGWNALGPGVWVPPPGRPQGGIEARNGEYISLRAPASGVTFQACSVTIVIEED